MELKLIDHELNLILKKSRYQHSIGVKDVACDLAAIYGYDMNKAEIAGILHDCAKYLTDEQLLEKCEEYHLSVTEIERKCPFLLHGKVGAIFARDKYGIEDEEILNAIIYHTTGRPAMTLLEKIIFTADYIEPFRKLIPKIDVIREIAYSDLDLAVTMTLENILNYLKQSSSEIDDMTEETYNYYNEFLETRLK